MLLGRRGEVMGECFSSLQERPISLCRSGSIFMPREVVDVDDSPEVDGLPLKWHREPSPASHSWEMSSDIQRTTYKCGRFFIRWSFLLEGFWRHRQSIEFLFLQLLETAVASFSTNYRMCISCRLWGISQKRMAAVGCPACTKSLTPAEWEADIPFVHQDIVDPRPRSRAICSIQEAWGLCRGASGKVVWLPLLPRLAFSTNYLEWRPSKGSCPNFICSKEIFYVYSVWLFVWIILVTQV